MSARRAVILIAAMSLAACSHVQWSGKYMTGPAKRRLASEERAVQALNAYFDAAKDVIGLSRTGTHGDCLDAYWEGGSLTPERKRRMNADKVCSLVLKRYDAAASDLTGYGQAPSGEFPWLGELFEYVVRTETIKSKEEKMAEFDRYVIKNFEQLLAGQDSPVIPYVAKDYYAIRGTCCREVTVFDDWYQKRFERLSSR